MLPAQTTKHSGGGAFFTAAARVFGFLASVQLAIFILLTLIAVLATGTIIESLHGTDAARLIVYQSPWFSAILVILGINVTAAAVSRLPWKKKHIGFVTTHVGIILILIGSLISQQRMIDGQVTVAEGETESNITLPEPVLYVFSEDFTRSWAVPFRKKPFPWEGEAVIDQKERTPFEITLLDYFPLSKIDESLVPGMEGPAAVHVNLANSFVQENLWLIEEHSSMGEKQVGPAKISFKKAFLKEDAPGKTTEAFLEFDMNGRKIQVPVGTHTPQLKEIPLEGTPYTVSIAGIYRNAVIVGKQLMEEDPGEEADPAKWKNPAVRFVLSGNNIRETHTVFSKFPDFPTVHGMKPSETGGRVTFRIPGSEDGPAGHELRFVLNEGKLFYQVKDDKKLETGEITEGEEKETGWMNLNFKIMKFIPHTKVSREFTPLPNTSERIGARSAVRVDLQKDGVSTQTWLAQGIREKITLGDETYFLLYGQQRIPLGFKITLKDFRVEHYPGTGSPASFESDIIYKDTSRGVSEETTVSMNEPLEYRGYKVYQASYSQPEDGPEISTFAVGRDPGIVLKYLGAIVMVIGTVTMFSMRRFATRGVSKQ